MSNVVVVESEVCQAWKLLCGSASERGHIIIIKLLFCPKIILLESSFMKQLESRIMCMVKGEHNDKYNRVWGMST